MGKGGWMFVALCYAPERSWPSCLSKLARSCSSIARMIQISESKGCPVGDRSFSDRMRLTRAMNREIRRWVRRFSGIAYRGSFSHATSITQSDWSIDCCPIPAVTLDVVRALEGGFGEGRIGRGLAFVRQCSIQPRS